MKHLRYPPRVLYGDYLRSAAGLVVGLGVLLAVPPNPIIAVVFGSLTALFGTFGLRTAHRHTLRVTVTGEAIACRATTTRVIPWSDIAAMKLRYYGSRRSRWRPLGGGFMQLTLKGTGRAMTFESSIEGFEWLAGQAAAAMRARGLPLDPATASNLIELGIDPEDPGAGSPTDGCGSSPNVL